MLISVEKPAESGCVSDTEGVRMAFSPESDFSLHAVSNANDSRVSDKKYLRGFIPVMFSSPLF